MDKKRIEAFYNSLSDKVKDRTIGLELEFSNGDKEKIKLPKGYAHTDNKFTNHFNTTCVEIRNNARYGGEINTKPIRLCYEDLDELRTLFNNIWDAGGVLNWYIDTHIHIFVKDMEIEDLHKINTAIFLLGNLMRSVFHIGAWNDTPYAVPLMTKETKDKVNETQSIEEIANVFKNGSQRGFHRPYISMAQIETIGTMEYRQFGGTKDMEDVWEFIKFSYRFIDYCISHTEEEVKQIKTEEQFVKVFQIDTDRLGEQLQPFIYSADHKDNVTNVGQMFNKTKPIFSTIKKAVGDKKVLLCGSWNFDVEQALSKNSLDVYSTNAYTHFIYEIINGNREYKLPIEFDFLQYDEKATSKADKIARLLLFFELEKKINQESFYAKRFYKNTVENLDTVLRKMIEKASRIVENLEGRVTVKYGTFNDMVEAQQKDEAIIYHYEEPSQLKALHNKIVKFFDYEMERPLNDYSIYTEFENYVFVSQNKFLPYEKAYSDGRNYVYTDMQEKSVFKITVRDTETLYYKELPKDYEITKKSKIKYIKAKIGEVDYIRQKYLSKKIIMGSAPYCYLWFIDDYLFGACMLDYPKRNIGAGTGWLKSDFVIDSNVPKLSKLLIICILSDEFKKELSIRYKENIKQLVTNVFTDKPVSMKYRGVFKLHARENGKLIYVGKTGKYGRINVEGKQKYQNIIK